MLLAAFGPAHALTQRATEALAAALRAQDRDAEADTLVAAADTPALDSP